jgi:hypothetical protein
LKNRTVDIEVGVGMPIEERLLDDFSAVEVEDPDGMLDDGGERLSSSACGRGDDWVHTVSSSSLGGAYAAAGSDDDDDDDDDDVEEQPVAFKYKSMKLMGLARPQVLWLGLGCLCLLVRLPFSLAMPHFVSEVK